MKIYELQVVEIPTNEPMIRNDQNDQIYKTKDGKWTAVASEIEDRNRPASRCSSGRSRSRCRSCCQRLSQRGIDTPCSTPSPSTPSARARRSPRRAPLCGHDRDQHGRPRRGHQARRQRRAPSPSQELTKLGLEQGSDEWDEAWDEVFRRWSSRWSRTARRSDGGRRAVHLRHRAPRVAPHRQPAARPLRPPGRSRRVALLPVRRGRSRAAVRGRSHLQDPRQQVPRRRTKRATRCRSSTRCSPSRSRGPRRRSRSRTS